MTTGKFKAGDILTSPSAYAPDIEILRVLMVSYEVRISTQPDSDPFLYSEHEIIDDGYVLKTDGKPGTSYSAPSHSAHEVVTNEVLGKTFRYCRDCKEEVF